jgi:hypothetical protein
MIDTVIMSEDEYSEHTDEYNGLCLACGAIREGSTEPDAENYPCEDCGQNKVVGMENALVMGLIEFSEED